MDDSFGNDVRKIMATIQVLLRNSTGRAEENHEEISHGNRSAGHYLKSVFPEYETGTLIIGPRHSVSAKNRFCISDVYNSL
jgi:hypothetical protein